MKGLFLCLLSLSVAGPAAAQGEKPGWGKAWPELMGQSTKSPFRGIPEGYEFVHWDDLDAEDSLESFWFSKADEWRFVEGDLDDGAGNVAEGVGPALFFKSSRTYKSRVRAPQSIALVKNLRVGGDFVLEVEMMQTGIETAHRDLCLFFGFEGPERFFYNHLGKVPDPHSSNVFDVNRADRVRIGDVSRSEINWGRGVWHRVRLECEWDDAKGGRMRTYFDDMETPLFEKPLPREAAGLVGLGSFDDAGAFRNLHVWAKESSKATGNLNPFGDEVTLKLSSVDPGSGGLQIFGAGSAKVSILGEEYRVGMVRTRDGKVFSRESNGFFFDDGLDWAFETDEGLRKVKEQAYRKEFRWVITDPKVLGAAPGLVGLDETVVLECGLSVHAEVAYEPDTTSGISREPIYGVKLRVVPAAESRSRFLARRHYGIDSAFAPMDVERGWRWTTDLVGALAEGGDPRPVLLAITPKGSEFDANLDLLLSGDSDLHARVMGGYRCLRVDPSVIAGSSVRWPGAIPLDRRGLPQCALLIAKGEIQLLCLDEPAALRELNAR